MFVYPGNHYLGPGNNLNNGEPVNNADKIAQEHDFKYTIAKTEKDIFDADKEAIKKFNDVKYMVLVNILQVQLVNMV